MFIVKRGTEAVPLEEVCLQLRWSPVVPHLPWGCLLSWPSTLKELPTTVNCVQTAYWQRTLTTYLNDICALFDQVLAGMEQEGNVLILQKKLQANALIQPFSLIYK